MLAIVVPRRCPKTDRPCWRRRRLGSTRSPAGGRPTVRAGRRCPEPSASGSGDRRLPAKPGRLEPYRDTVFIAPWQTPQRSPEGAKDPFQRARLGKPTLHHFYNDSGIRQFGSLAVDSIAARTAAMRPLPSTMAIISASQPPCPSWTFPPLI